MSGKLRTLWVDAVEKGLRTWPNSDSSESTDHGLGGEDDHPIADIALRTAIGRKVLPTPDIRPGRSLTKRG